MNHLLRGDSKSVRKERVWWGNS